ncbi:hypothetical protein MKJ04_20140 [Pontibacter sp. E15-1]|uniref:hypothetical protein n=1 Tax=Pontibacter sp. E15-1 TaxID=2919918 RepID=UPI001F4F3C12|nr:hypothetical protein [Pontibacter sp. E15-1]MCJ8167162.1 hypothetical protein [Pontibacter sp. E15-1]
MISVLNRISTWRYILPLFASFCFVTFRIFPTYSSRLQDIAGQEIQLLDIRFSYATSEVLYDFEKLGTEGRDLYKVIAGRIDMIYPIIYGLLFISVLAYLLKRVTNTNSKLLFIATLPALGVTFDYLENLNTLSLLNDFPNLTDQGVAWGEQMTRMKLGSLFFSFVVAFSLASFLLIKSLMNCKENKIVHRLM